MTDLQLVCHTHPVPLHSDAFTAGFEAEAGQAWAYRRVLADLAKAGFDVWNDLTDLPGGVIAFMITHTDCRVTVHNADTREHHGELPEWPEYAIRRVVPDWQAMRAATVHDPPGSAHDFMRMPSVPSPDPSLIYPREQP